jgi:hypothetical protein
VHLSYHPESVFLGQQYRGYAMTRGGKFFGVHRRQCMSNRKNFHIQQQEDKEQHVLGSDERVGWKKGTHSMCPLLASFLLFFFCGASILLFAFYLTLLCFSVAHPQSSPL